MVNGLREISYERPLEILDLYPLESRRLRGDLIFTFSLFKNERAEELFQLSGPQSLLLRGHKKRIFKERPRAFIRQHFFSFRVVNHWNRLPAAVVDSTTTRSFKKGVDTSLGLTTTPQ